MSGAFEGIRAVVTGSASGIGAAIVDALLYGGATVVGLDVTAAGDHQASLEAADRFEHIVTDVSDESSVESAVGHVLRSETPRCLFNVAGIGSTTTAPDTSVEIWDQVFAVNARGTFLLCKHLIPPMASAGTGSIVNIASIAGLVGLRNRAAYCASKGAVIALTRALAVDHVGDGIRVNCVCPGTIDSPWVRRLVEDAGESLDALRARQPMGRLGTPEEVAEAALYLASDAAGFATGTVLTLDGGLTAA